MINIDLISNNLLLLLEYVKYMKNKLQNVLKHIVI